MENYAGETLKVKEVLGGGCPLWSSNGFSTERVIGILRQVDNVEPKTLGGGKHKNLI